MTEFSNPINLYFWVTSDRFVLVAGESYPETLEAAAFIICGASSRVAIPDRLHVLMRDKADGGFNPLLSVSSVEDSQGLHHQLHISSHNDRAETVPFDAIEAHVENLAKKSNTDETPEGDAVFHGLHAESGKKADKFPFAWEEEHLGPHGSVKYRWEPGMHDKVFDENQGQIVLKSHYFPSGGAIYTLEPLKPKPTAKTPEPEPYLDPTSAPSIICKALVMYLYHSDWFPSAKSWRTRPLTRRDRSLRAWSQNCSCLARWVLVSVSDREWKFWHGVRKAFRNTIYLPLKM